MIQFNELRIDETQNLIVDVSLLDIAKDPDKEITISDVIVGFGSTTNVTNYIDRIDESSLFPRVDRLSNGSIRGFRMILDLATTNSVNNLNTVNSLIYVKVGAEVPVAIDAVIDCESTLPRQIEGYVYDKCLLMNSIFTYLKESGNNCGEVTNLANYIAKIKGLELAIEGGNFDLANKYWNKFFMNNSTGVSSSNCGCR